MAHSILTLKNRFVEWGRAITSDRDPFELAGLLLLLILPFHIIEKPADRILFSLLIVPAILFPAVLRSRGYWISFSTALAVLFIFFGLISPVPNHMYMITYAVLFFSIFLHFRRATSDSAVFYSHFSKGAGLIVGLCFLFATLGKILSPDFLNGSFFVHVMLTDGRFEGFRNFVTSLSADQNAENMAQYRMLLQTNDPSLVANLTAPPAITYFAFIFTWWTVLIEGLLAGLFLLCCRYKLRVAAHAALIVFIVSTYSLTSVLGFSSILITLGYMFALNEGKITGTAMIYLLLFATAPLLNGFAELIF